MPVVQTLELQTAGVQSAPSNGSSHPVRTGTMLDVVLDVTSVSGTSTPSLSAWLQVSFDNVIWVDIPASITLVNAATTQAQQTGVINKRNINGDSLITAAARHFARYSHLPAGYVRLVWNITGSFTGGQGFTFSAKGDVK